MGPTRHLIGCDLGCTTWAGSFQSHIPTITPPTQLQPPMPCPEPGSERESCLSSQPVRLPSSHPAPSPSMLAANAKSDTCRRYGTGDSPHSTGEREGKKRKGKERKASIHSSIPDRSPATSAQSLHCEGFIDPSKVVDQGRPGPVGMHHDEPGGRSNRPSAKTSSSSSSHRLPLIACRTYNNSQTVMTFAISESHALHLRAA